MTEGHYRTQDKSADSTPTEAGQRPRSQMDEAIDDDAGTPPGQEAPHHRGQREAVKERAKTRDRDKREGSTHRPRSVSSLLIRFNAMSVVR